jgi:DNA-binding NtrC family response regulator
VTAAAPSSKNKESNMTNTPEFRVLLVDDDPSMLHFLKEILLDGLSEELQIRTACDPKEARRCLETDIVDLLVTDLEMPGVNGLELLRCAKRRNAWTQVLLVTGHSNLDSLVDAMELGAIDYLLKPVNVRELKEAAQSCYRRYSRWQEALAGTLAAH